MLCNTCVLYGLSTMHTLVHAAQTRALHTRVTAITCESSNGK